jgi:hypothetical protein
MTFRFTFFSVLAAFILPTFGDVPAQQQALRRFEGYRGVPRSPGRAEDLKDIGDSVLGFWVVGKPGIVRGRSEVVLSASPFSTMVRTYSGKVTGKVISTPTHYRAMINIRSVEGDVIRGTFESFLSPAGFVEDGDYPRYLMHIRFQGTISNPALLGIAKKNFTLKRTFFTPY